MAFDIDFQALVSLTIEALGLGHCRPCQFSWAESTLGSSEVCCRTRVAMLCAGVLRLLPATATRTSKATQRYCRRWDCERGLGTTGFHSLRCAVKGTFITQTGPWWPGASLKTPLPGKCNHVRPAHDIPWVSSTTHTKIHVFRFIIICSCFAASIAKLHG